MNMFKIYFFTETLTENWGFQKDFRGVNRGRDNATWSGLSELGRGNGI